MADADMAAVLEHARQLIVEQKSDNQQELINRCIDMVYIYTNHIKIVYNKAINTRAFKDQVLEKLSS